MLDLTWKVFSETGSIDTYLLYKEIEKDNDNAQVEQEQLADLDFPVTRMTN
ncbi:YqzL family protein [Bacillus thermotolerans]|uniref:YqzL family protein n=1 Tax=Bacillus thermotolerans TaxID=1221996 RepID=A0A0F5HJ04_BACTR|nr:YqzL family protein [Bacillus thermotolerans]KKB33379.1 hypothetical protein QY97_03353 [Bacillus thermotolerans]KKB41888.1 hypothetical protein QY96_01790 [Bacillus thermotolerans]KKB43046.1 hypothetical protein QY95_02646 [Bacillus thermotolerans]